MARPEAGQRSPAGPRAFLGDFGLTRFMAPEQVRQQPLDRRCDVYSLASLAYACLAGQPPFPGRHAREVMRAQVEQPPPPLPGRGLDVSAWLHGAVLAGLAKDPAYRPPTAGGFVAACRQARDADLAGVPALRPRPGKRR